MLASKDAGNVTSKNHKRSMRDRSTHRGRHCAFIYVDMVKPGLLFQGLAVLI